MTWRHQNADCCHGVGARTREDGLSAVGHFGSPVARSRPLQDATRAYPPWYPGPARCRGGTDYQSKSGAERLATIIREAWRACGVIVPIRIEEQIGPDREAQHRALHVVRVELIGGLPGRVG